MVASLILYYYFLRLQFLGCEGVGFRPHPPHPHIWLRPVIVPLPVTLRERGHTFSALRTEAPSTTSLESWASAVALSALCWYPAHTPASVASYHVGPVFSLHF